MMHNVMTTSIVMSTSVDCYDDIELFRQLYTIVNENYYTAVFH